MRIRALASKAEGSPGWLLGQCAEIADRALHPDDIRPHAPRECPGPDEADRAAARLHYGGLASGEAEWRRKAADTIRSEYRATFAIAPGLERRMSELFAALERIARFPGVPFEVAEEAMKAISPTHGMGGYPPQENDR